MGYNGSFKKINYSVNYSIDRVEDKESWPENRQISINIDIPFSIFSNNELAENIYSTYSYAQDNDGNISQQVGLSGSSKDGKFSYGVSQAYGNKGVGGSGALYSNYSTSNLGISAGYNYSKDNQSVNGSLSGGMLLHEGGLLFSRSIGESGIIIEAPDAKGTKTNNQDSIINGQGYALYPYATAYSSNIVSLDVNTLPDDVMLKETTKTVYPSAGAFVKAKFDTKVGYQVLFTLRSSDGRPVPFGAIATLLESNVTEENTGIVGDNNQLFMSGLSNSGKLNVSWGNGQDQRCVVNFSGLDKVPMTRSQPVRTVPVDCR